MVRLCNASDFRQLFGQESNENAHLVEELVEWLTNISLFHLPGLLCSKSFQIDLTLTEML